MIDTKDPNDLRRFIDAYLRSLREGAAEKGLKLKDSAWLYASDDHGIKSADQPSLAMTAFIQYHERHLEGLLRHATLFVYWAWGDPAASVLIMPAIVNDNHAEFD